MWHGRNRMSVVTKKENTNLLCFPQEAVKKLTGSQQRMLSNCKKMTEDKTLIAIND